MGSDPATTEATKLLICPFETPLVGNAAMDFLNHSPFESTDPLTLEKHDKPWLSIIQFGYIMRNSILNAQMRSPLTAGWLQNAKKSFFQNILMTMETSYSVFKLRVPRK
jgi:hypothetical protein